jgi:hypothetical protein
MTDPLSPEELGELLRQLNTAMRKQRERVIAIGTLAGLFIAAAIVVGILYGPGAAIAPGLAGAIAGVALVFAIRDVRSSKWQPVIVALRDDPAQITRVRRFSADSGVSYSVETATHALETKFSERTFLLLQRHCPGAMVVDA